MTRGDQATLAFGLLLALSLAPAAGVGQIAASGTTLVSFVEHRVDIGYGVEKSSGPLLGAEGAVDLWSRLALRIRAAGGSLSTQAVGAQDRDLGELGIQASVVAVRWLALRGGATWRTYSTAIARQRWTTVELGAEARLDFATSPVRGVLRAGLLPVVSVEGLPGPDVALTAAAGIEYSARSVTGGLFYGLERYDFPDQGTGRRLEQVSTLTLRLSVRRQ
ncbi:MAG: hypothetical protein DMD28_13840 [Gemmatimonadetes bacterium]|nr:MAG: hypothetical protein DMD28_13840 [Gemmatimonadota bacterium]